MTVTALAKLGMSAWRRPGNLEKLLPARMDGPPAHRLTGLAEARRKLDLPPPMGERSLASKLESFPEVRLTRNDPVSVAAPPAQVFVAHRTPGMVDSGAEAARHAGRQIDPAARHLPDPIMNDWLLDHGLDAHAAKLRSHMDAPRRTVTGAPSLRAAVEAGGGEAGPAHALVSTVPATPAQRYFVPGRPGTPAGHYGEGSLAEPAVPGLPPGTLAEVTDAHTRTFRPGLLTRLTDRLLGRKTEIEFGSYGSYPKTPGRATGPGERTYRPLLAEVDGAPSGRYLTDRTGTSELGRDFPPTPANDALLKQMQLRLQPPV